MLKDGKFTTVKPTPQTEKTYDSTTTKYSKIVKVTESTATAESPVNNIAYTNEDGIITFVGLGAGEYTITELEAPEGYNKLKAPIKIRIDATVEQNAQTCAWTVVKDDDNEHPLTATDNLFGFTVENNEGITLPGTGGMGTTIFYVVGGLLILCAGALLVTKVRMAHKEK
jgi:LPXTG-motif cell wall-anchored protein